MRVLLCDEEGITAKVVVRVTLDRLRKDEYDEDETENAMFGSTEGLRVLIDGEDIDLRPGDRPSDIESPKQRPEENGLG